MSREKNPAIIKKALDWAYEKAINGAGMVESAALLAEDYQKVFSDREKAIDSLINWQTTKCATSGFITGVGGLLTLPIAIPANVSSVLFIQLRMIAAIAIMRGYDPKSDQVLPGGIRAPLGKRQVVFAGAPGVAVAFYRDARRRPPAKPFRVRLNDNARVGPQRELVVIE